MSTNDLGTLERVRAELDAEAAELERDADKSPAFIEGLRYGAAFIGARTSGAVDLAALALENAAAAFEADPFPDIPDDIKRIYAMGLRMRAKAPRG